MFKWLRRDRSAQRRRSDLEINKLKIIHQNTSLTNDDNNMSDNLEDPIRTPEYKQALAEFYARRSIGPIPKLNNTDYSQTPTGRKSYADNRRIRSEPKPKRQSLPNSLPQINLLFGNKIFMNGLKNKTKQKKNNKITSLPPDILPLEKSEIWEYFNEDCILTDSPPDSFFKKNSLPYNEENTTCTQSYKHEGNIVNNLYGLPVISIEDIQEHGYMSQGQRWSFGEWAGTKITIKNNNTDPQYRYFVDDDLGINAISRHPNILLVMAVIYEQDFISKCIFESYTSTLQDIIYNKDETQCIDYIIDITDALTYLLINGYIHTSISPYNIMITSKNVAKLTSFELSSAIHRGSEQNESLLEPEYVNMTSLKEKKSKLHEIAGQRLKDREYFFTTFNNFRFNAPELFEEINGLVYPCLNTDVYSLCLILLQCCTGQEPFEKYCYKELSDMYVLWQNSVRLPEDISPILYNILEEGLCINPDQRLTIQVLSKKLTNAKVLLKSPKSNKDNISTESIRNTSDKSISMDNTDSTEYCPLFTPEIKRFLSRSNMNDTKIKSKLSFNESSLKSPENEESPNKIIETNTTKTENTHLQQDSNTNYYSLPANLDNNDNDKDPFISLDFNDKLSLFGSNIKHNNNKKHLRFAKQLCESSEECSVDIHSLVAIHEKWISERTEKYSQSLSLPTDYRSSRVAVKPASHHIAIDSQENRQNYQDMKSVNITNNNYDKPNELSFKYEYSSTPYSQKRQVTSNKYSKKLDNQVSLDDAGLKMTFERIKKEFTSDNIVKPSNIKYYFSGKSVQNNCEVHGDDKTKKTLTLQECQSIEDMYIDDEFPAMSTETQNILSPNMQLIPLHGKHEAICTKGSDCCILHIQQLTNSNQIYIVCQQNEQNLDFQEHTNNSKENKQLSEMDEIIIDALQNITTKSDSIEDNNNISLFIINTTNTSSSENIVITDDDDIIQL